ncbi:MAG: aminotransferase class IV [Verrucomicrobiota bacterium]
MPLILRNDTLVSSDEPGVHLNDSAVVQGHGLFETLKIYKGTPFALDKHLDRMAQSCQKLGLNAIDRKDTEHAIRRLLEANEMTGHAHCRLRITITGGIDEQVTFLEVTPSPTHAATATAITGPFVRNDQGLLSGVKTISYGENAIASHITSQSGATEALWSNTLGYLCEGTWSNVFVRHNGEWKTPPLSSGCLPGVTRSFVLQLAAINGISISQTPVTMSELSKVDAAFFTSSIREIQAIHRIDGKDLVISEAPEIESIKDAYAEMVDDFIRSTS